MSLISSQKSQKLAPIKLGVVGLGRGFSLTARGLLVHPQIDVVAGSSRNESARSKFAKDFSARTYSEIHELCADSEVEIVYVATPHELHCSHVQQCAGAGKHVVVEKPMAITLDDAKAMVDTCETAGVKLIVGPSHSFDSPVLKAREYIKSGQLGSVRMLHSFYATDFLYRPRTSAELQTDQGGVIFSQGVHQVDVIRMLCGSAITEVRAFAGQWDADRPQPGAYTAQLGFADGAFASLTYSGYAHYDGDECMGNVSELGIRKETGVYGKARAHLAHTDDEAAAKATRRFNGVAETPDPNTHEHFGLVIVFCDHGDIRLYPHGIEVFDNHQRTFLACEFKFCRQSFCDSLVQAVRFNQAPPQDGRWGLESLRVCDAILQSHLQNSVVKLD